MTLYRDKIFIASAIVLAAALLSHATISAEKSKEESQIIELPKVVVYADSIPADSIELPVVVIRAESAAEPHTIVFVMPEIHVTSGVVN